MICWLRGSIPSLEQPRNSMLVVQPVMQIWVKLLEGQGESLHQHDVDLGRFGAPTQKPVHIYCPVVMDLEVPLDTHQRNTDHPPTAIVCTPQIISHPVCFHYCDSYSPRYEDSLGQQRVQGAEGLHATQDSSPCTQKHHQCIHVPSAMPGISS